MLPRPPQGRGGDVRGTVLQAIGTGCKGTERMILVHSRDLNIFTVIELLSSMRGA